MERLTKATDDLSFLCNHLRRETKFDAQRIKDIHDRLAAYEDTGLEPKDFKKVFNEDAVLKLAGQVLSVTLDRLRELAEADKDGRCAVLPCKVGDEIFPFCWSIKNQKYEVFSGRVKNVRYDSADGSVMVSNGEFYRVLGKTVFLTREPAEKALEEHK